MNPLTHFLLSWLVANSSPLSKRERAVVTLAGILPDLDGVGIVVERLTGESERPLLWWTEYHHVLAHNLLFGVGIATAAAVASSRRWMAAALAFAAFHLHVLGDLAGARGPDGFQWPIHYLWPFWGELELVWSGQWGFNSWPNLVITAAALVLTFRLAWQRGYSPLEMISSAADRAFVGALRRRFPGVG